MGFRQIISNFHQIAKNSKISVKRLSNGIISKWFYEIISTKKSQKPLLSKKKKLCWKNSVFYKAKTFKFFEIGVFTKMGRRKICPWWTEVISPLEQNS